MTQNYLPMSYLELQLNFKQYLTLLLETIKSWGTDLQTDVEREIESELEYLGVKGCSEPFYFKKLLSTELKILGIVLKVEGFAYIRIFKNI